MFIIAEQTICLEKERKRRESDSAFPLCLFTVPKDDQLFNAWKRAIPRDGLTLNSKVCEKHFRPDEIISHFVSTNKDVEFSIKRQRKKLVNGAIPSVFPGKIVTTSKKDC